MSENNYQPTLEQIQQWKELEELETNAFAGRALSKEEFTRCYNSLVDGSIFTQHLENVRKNKQKLLEQLADIEEHEAWVVQRIEEMNNKNKQ